jgi:hypothetical protein
MRIFGQGSLRSFPNLSQHTSPFRILPRHPDLRLRDVASFHRLAKGRAKNRLGERSFLPDIQNRSHCIRHRDTIEDFPVLSPDVVAM